jgi:hypothetical protein
MRLVRVSLLAALVLCANVYAAIQFRAQEIQQKFGVVYAVLTADINGDRKPDIVAINPTQVVWYENPTWEKHVVLDGVTKKDNVAIAASDIDGDEKLDLALGADWQPTNTASGGSIQWIGRDAKNPSAPWKMTPITDEPTTHRMRWGDIDGDGKPELVVMPLQGRGTKGPKWEEGQGVRILVFHVPPHPATDKWPMEVADESLHIIHNFIIQDGEIWTASAEGINAFKRAKDGKWSHRKIAEGAPGEIKLGRVNNKRHLATIEPWHGNTLVLYEEAGANELWKRKVIASDFSGGHALGWGDFVRDGSDELVVGWRTKPFGVAIFKRDPSGEWKKTMIDAGGMATEDLTVADLNGDDKPEIIAVGRATENIKIYWNDSTLDPN